MAARLLRRVALAIGLLGVGQVVPVAVVGAATGVPDPVGFMDAASAQLHDFGWAVATRGWVVDPSDPTRSVPVRTRLFAPDGAELALAPDLESSDTTLADSPRPDVAAALAGAGRAHGWASSRWVDFAGSPFANPVRVCVDAVVRRDGSERLVRIACRNVTVGNRAPLGALERAVSPFPGTIEVVGWAADRDSLGDPVIVLSLDDAPVRFNRTDRLLFETRRPELGPGLAELAGFDAALLGVAPGEHEVCGRVPDIGVRGAGVELGCRSVTVRARAVSDPAGFLDSVRATAVGSARVRGWAFDPDDRTAPATVRAFVAGWSGTPRAVTPTNLARRDVSAAFPVAGPNHGFDAELSGVTAGMTVCVVALNTAGPGVSVLLGCAAVG